MIEFLMIRENWEQALLLGLAIFIGMPIFISTYFHVKMWQLRGRHGSGQPQNGPDPSSKNAARYLSTGIEMWKRVRRGEFGREAQKLIRNCVLGMVMWVAITAAWFSVLLYVDAQVMNKGGWPGHQAVPPTNQTQNLKNAAES